MRKYKRISYKGHNVSKLETNVLVLQADKYNKTIIMNKSEYENKMYTMLNDKKTTKWKNEI